MKKGGLPARLHEKEDCQRDKRKRGWSWFVV